MTSLWLAQSSRPLVEARRLDERSADVAVVGAGITGLFTVLLAGAGKDVLVLEPRTVGAVTTGNTAGKISLLQDTLLSKITARHGADIARDYMRATGRANSGCCATARPTAFRCSARPPTPMPSRLARYPLHGRSRPLAAWRAWMSNGTATPMCHSRITAVYGWQVRRSLIQCRCWTALLESRPATGVGSLRVPACSDYHSIAAGCGSRCKTGHGEVDVDTGQCLLATGIPIVDRGGFFARVKPSRPYCIAFDVPGDITRPMLISAGSPTRSVRHAPVGDGEHLIVAGAGHTVGRKSPRAELEELSSWARTHYPGAVETHNWSAQDYVPVDQLPYVGPILPGNEKGFAATGFNKWGLAKGAAAALVLSGLTLGGRMDWARAFAAWSPHELSGITTAVSTNLEVATRDGQRMAATAADRPHSGLGRRRRCFSPTNVGYARNVGAYLEHTALKRLCANEAEASSVNACAISVCTPMRWILLGSN